MTDSNRPHPEDSIDCCVRGELAGPEARELAQKSLDDSELFEDLTYAALAKAALANPSVREQLQQSASDAKVLRFPRRARVWIPSAAAAAGLVLLSVYFTRSLLRQERSEVSQNRPSETATTSPLQPTLAFSAEPVQPVLLAKELQLELTRPEGAPVFRGATPDSRAPRPTGLIIAMEDGLATVDLGSLDGLAKGGELRVFRDEKSEQGIGLLRVSTVFRERARGQILGNRAIQVNDRVRVADGTHLAALSQQVDALSARGDWNEARKIAENAVSWAESANVSPGERRKALERLAVLEYHAGAVQAAEKHYQATVDTLQQSPTSLGEASVALNNLAVLRMLRGDRNGAEAFLNQASRSGLTDSAHGRSLNNLGVLAELRGDRRKAEAFYREAVTAFARLPDSFAQERRVVETNLARLSSAR